MLRPSTERGMPALGCAARGREVTARTRSMASSMATGPTLQLMPSTSTFHSVSRAAKASGSEPSRQLPSSSIVTWATMGRTESSGFDVAAGQHGLVQFFDVAEGFEHQQIDAALDQGRDLFAERRARLFKRSLAQRFNANAQRADRSGDPNVETLGCFASHVSAGQIDVAHAIGQAVPRQAKAVRAESIGFDNLGAGLQVIVVHGADQLRLRQVQLVIAAVDENALGIEKRPHGSVTEHGRLLQTFNKVLWHLLENTRSSGIIESLSDCGIESLKVKGSWIFNASVSKCLNDSMPFLPPQFFLCYNPCSRIQVIIRHEVGVPGLKKS
jgi:hypothetical protein